MSDFHGVYDARRAVNEAAAKLVEALDKLERCVSADEYKTSYRYALNRLHFKAKEFALELEEGIS